MRRCVDLRQASVHTRDEGIENPSHYEYIRGISGMTEIYQQVVSEPPGENSPAFAGYRRQGWREEYTMRDSRAEYEGNQDK